MSAVAALTDEEACARCGAAPRLPGSRSTWCRSCKAAWQRDYRAGIRLQKRVPPPVETLSGCLLWQGYVNLATGYGQQTVNGVTQYAHRVAWEAVHGPIPADLTIDHLCRVKTCLNVTHMELVTRGENTRRAVQHRASGWCRKHGREMDRTTPKGRRYCSHCVKESNARRRAK